MSPLPKVPTPWRSTTTRVVVSYGLFFVLWTLLLVMLIYVETAKRLSDEAEHQLKERAEYFAAMDPSLVTVGLQAMYDFDALHINAYGLFDPQGHPLAGHLAALPEGLLLDGASHIYKLPADGGGTGTPTSTRILGIRLRNGDQLLLARDAGLIDQIRGLILRAVLWGLSLTIVPGVAGGFLLIAGPLRRIRAACRRPASASPPARSTSACRWPAAATSSTCWPPSSTACSTRSSA